MTFDGEPFSWQQEGRMRRAADRGERVRNVVQTIPIPPELDAAELRARLTAAARREESLRITSMSLDAGTTYDDAAEPDIRAKHVPSGADIEALDEQETVADLQAGDGPMWRATLVSCRSGDGPGRYLLTSFDHLVTDGYSQARLVDELLGAADGNGGGGSFREWVEWQRGEYPDPRSETSGAFSFWERYLDGTVPDRSAGLTFATGDDGALTGQVHTVRRTLPVSAQTLTRAAARGRMTPFVLFLGIATHAATRFTPDPDITFRVNTMGRPPRFLDTHGYFSDNLPVRVAGDELGDPLAAVRAARRSWMSVLPHQLTPWDYLLAAFCPPGHGIMGRPAQALLNFESWLQPAFSRLPEGDFSYATPMRTFQTAASMYDDDTCILECSYDPGRFARSGVDEYIGLVLQTAALVCAALADS